MDLGKETSSKMLSISEGSCRCLTSGYVDNGNGTTTCITCGKTWNHKKYGARGKKNKLNENARTIDDEEMLTYEDFDKEFPIINGNKINGLTIRTDIPNTSSIESSLTNYKILKGIRQVTFPIEKHNYYSVDENERVKQLVKEIKHNKEINPLIVYLDDKDVYILEGLHRYYALQELKIKSFPAIVVLDLDSLNIINEVHHPIEFSDRDVLSVEKAGSTILWRSPIFKTGWVYNSKRISTRFF